MQYKQLLLNSIIKTLRNAQDVKVYTQYTSYLKYCASRGRSCYVTEPPSGRPQFQVPDAVAWYMCVHDRTCSWENREGIAAQLSSRGVGLISHFPPSSVSLRQAYTP